MFCTKCGKQLQPGDEFCQSCGAPVQAGARAPASAHGPSPAHAGGKRNFFSTPGGIVLLVAIALVVIGGAVLGVVLLTRGKDGTADFEERTSKAWDGFSEEVEDIDDKLSGVDDLTRLTSADQIEDFQEDLERHREAVEGSIDEFKSVEAPDEWKDTYEEFIDSLELYLEYLEELNRFYKIYTRDPMDTRLNEILDEMKDMAGKIRPGVLDFLKKNSLINDTSFEPDILDLPSEYAKQLAQVQQEQSTNQELASARAAMDVVLSTYLSGGWYSLSNLMTPECYDRYRNEAPPPDQGDFDVIDISVVDASITGPDTVVFTVLQSIRTWDGEEFQDYMHWEMVKRGDTWLLNSIGYIQ